MKKILIVDDVPMITTMLKHFLENDFELSIAHNAEEAFGRIPVFKPDAIITDNIMPGEMSGYDLCKLVKSIDQFKHIYILMLTADWKTVQQEGDEFCADDYTFKPFYGSEIAKIMKKALYPVPDFQDSVSPDEKQEIINNVVRIHQHS